MNALLGLVKKQLAWVVAIVIAALVAVAVVQTLRLAAAKTELAQQGEKTAQAETKQTQAVLNDERETAQKESTHAEQTIAASDQFTQGEPGRIADLERDIDRVERLRSDAERRASTYRAQAQANAAACSNLADRLEAFDRQLVAGIEVVAGLRGDLARRDAEVVLLHDQLMADRGLLQP